MRSVIQRVSRARVLVDAKEISAIGAGLLVLIGFHSSDQLQHCEKFLDKLLKLRIFNDEAGKMNLSVQDVGGSILLVPQFTLYGDTTKGHRPSFMEAAKLEEGRALFEHILLMGTTCDVPVKGGVFQATMTVELVNEGPVTILT